MRAVAVLALLALCLSQASATTTTQVAGFLNIANVKTVDFTAEQQTNFIIGVANATDVSTGLVSITGYTQDIGEFLKVGFTVASTDVAVVEMLQSPSASRGTLAYIMNWAGVTGTVSFGSASVTTTDTDNDQIQNWLGGLSGLVIAVAILQRLGLRQLPSWNDGAPPRREEEDLDNIAGVQQVKA